MSNRRKASAQKGDTSVQFETVAALVRRVQKGDQAAFEQLYHLYLPQVYYAALKYLGDEEDATEVAQEVFSRVYTNITTLNAPMAFHKWINTITYNLSLNAIRDRESRQSALTEKDFSSYEELVSEENREFLPEECLETKEKQSQVVAVVDTLPEAQRSSIVMHYFEGLSVPEIAEITETAPDTIHKRLHDAKKTMRKKLGLAPEAAPAVSAAALPVLTQILKENALSVTTEEVSTEVAKKLYSGLGIAQPSAAVGTTAVTVGAKGASTLTKVLVALLVTSAVGAGGFAAYRASGAAEEPTVQEHTETRETTEHSKEESATVTQPPAEEQPPAPTEETAQSGEEEEIEEITAAQPVQEIFQPQIHAVRTVLVYYAGGSVTLPTIMSEAGVFAFDGGGARLPVVTGGYESIDFRTPGTYTLQCEAQDTYGRTAHLTLQVQIL